VTLSLAVFFEAAMQMKSAHLIKSCENQKKEKCRNKRYFYIHLPLKYRLDRINRKRWRHLPFL